MSGQPRLESVVLGILRWPEDMPDFTEEEVDALQQRHLAYQLELRERGILLAGGPLDEHVDARP